jgi:hypothetical protein
VDPVSHKLGFAWAGALLLTLVPQPAQAFELSGGVSMGGVLIGVDPRLAVTPHLGGVWHVGNVALAAQNQLNVLAAVNKLGVGVYNQASLSAGYAWKTGNVTLGPAFSAYSMPACSATLCGRVVGIGAGAHAQLNVYLVGPVGVSLSANVDWIGGSSLVLPGNVAAMIIAGPVFRWSPK